MFTLTFSYVSPETRDYAPLKDRFGNDITLMVDAVTKTEAIHSTDTFNFCVAQGNDCRVLEVR